jgi:hypothetical protein
MDIRNVLSASNRTQDPNSGKPAPPAGRANFRSQLLGATDRTGATPANEAKSVPSLPPLDRIAFGSRAAAQAPEAPRTAKSVAGAYGKQAPAAPPSDPLSDAAKYKDEQLLSNPGGDHYDLEKNRHEADPAWQKSFWGRVGKDLKDAVGNIRNFFGNLLYGAKIHYRDENGQVQEARQRGLLGSVKDFFLDLGSALSFGAWRPDGEAAPQGLGERVGFFFSKLKEAVFGDLIQGATGSVVRMGEDLLLAGWNLAETVPDATIGHFEAGRKATTAVFDNGQVAIDYLTDVLPGGEASVRVHSSDLENLEAPLLHNLNTPERNADDPRWKYVRNTPFRKALETAGSVVFDVLTLKFLGDLHVIGEDRNQAD